MSNILISKLSFDPFFVKSLDSVFLQMNKSEFIQAIECILFNRFNPRK